MKSLLKSLLAASVVLGMAAVCTPATFAADASPSASPAVKKVTRFPFHGKLQAIDTTAMTFTLSGTSARVFNVTTDTKIRKNGETAKLGDAVVGDDVGGYGMKSADGTLTALSVRFGPRTAPKKAAASPSASAQ